MVVHRDIESELEQINVQLKKHCNELSDKQTGTGNSNYIQVNYRTGE